MEIIRVFESRQDRMEIVDALYLQAPTALVVKLLAALCGADLLKRSAPILCRLYFWGKKLGGAFLFEVDDIVAALLALARLRLDQAEQVIRHRLLTLAQVVNVGMDVARMRVAPLGLF